MSHRRLLVVRRLAHQRYGRYRNVVGVGLGTKFKRAPGRPDSPAKVPGTTCIQFLVTRKQRSVAHGHNLPRFLYGRSLSGAVDYRERIPTDVIQVGGIHAAGGAGSRLDSNTEHGLITLIFRNQADPAQPFFLLSCAHVAGDMQRSPPADEALTSDCSPAQPFANTLVNSTAVAGDVSYDIALARIVTNALPLEELTIRGESFKLTGFIPAQFIQQGTWVSATLRNANPRGSIESLHATATIQYGSQLFQVHNLFGVNVAAQKGDSGGLIYQDAQAVGIVVAASPAGWLWFQPLEPAFQYLQAIAPFEISLFQPNPPLTDQPPTTP